MRRERTSSTLASCNLPSAVSISVPSPNQRWLIRRAVKSRLTRSGACQRPLPGRVELRRRRFARALRPCSAMIAATVFWLTRQPISCRSLVIRGAP
jgi:hypothetical protein